MSFDLLQDGLSCLLWLIIWVGAGWFFQQRHKLHGKEQCLFWLVLMLKIVGGITFGAYYMLVQQGGDPVAYHHCLQLLWENIEAEPAAYVNFLAVQAGDASLPYHIYFTQGSPLAMIKISSVMSIVTLNSYWGMHICLAGLIFFVSWYVFKGWRSSFDKLWWWGALCLLFLPSLLFWGSGWGKDGMLWLGLCMVLGGMLHLHKSITSSYRMFAQIGMIGLGSFVIGFLKPPLIEMIILACLMGIFVTYLRYFSRKIRIGLLVGGSMLLLAVMLWQQSFLVGLLSYQQWHTDAFDAGQSAYHLPEIKRIRELFFYLPYLIVSGLFRPFPWEWGNPMVIIGGIEALLAVVLLGIWFWQYGLMRTMQSLFGNPFAVSILTFALCLAVAAMLFSQNFGTLMRYRMPALALFLLSFWPKAGNE